MKYKITIILSCAIVLSTLASNPYEYEYDGYCCARALDRLLITVNYCLHSCQRRTPQNRLHRASLMHNTHEFYAALKDGADVNALDVHLFAGFTPPKTLKMLLDAGANPNLLDIERNTPAHLAILAGNAPALALLLQYGANVNMINAHQETLIGSAKNLNRTHCLDALANAKLLRQTKLNEKR